MGKMTGTAILLLAGAAYIGIDRFIISASVGIDLLTSDCPHPSAAEGAFYQPLQQTDPLRIIRLYAASSFGHFLLGCIPLFLRVNGIMRPREGKYLSFSFRSPVRPSII